MKKLDFEIHCYTKEVLDAFSERKDYPYFDWETKKLHMCKDVYMPMEGLYDGLTDVPDKRIEVMDKNGIDIAVLSASTGVEQLSAEICKQFNNTLYEYAKKYPGRYLITATLPINDISAALDEMERCVKDLGCVLWHTHSNYGESHLDDEKFLPLLKKAEELNLPIYLHPTNPDDERYKNLGYGFSGPALGFTVDTITTALRLIVKGRFDEMPNLRLVLGHLGETFPFLIERMNNRLTWLNEPEVKCQKTVGEYFKNKNIVVTTSGNMSREAFQCAKSVVGIDSIIFASDYPFEELPDMMNFMNSLNLTDEEYHKVFHENGEKLILNKNLEFCSHVQK